MALFCCSCLNITGVILESNGTSVSISAKNVSRDKIDQESYDKFFKNVIPIKSSSISIQHEALVVKIKIDNLTVNQCINCDSYVYAGFGLNDELLINAKLLCDEVQMKKMKNESFSKPFKIILKQIDQLSSTQVAINDEHVKALFNQLQDYIAWDQTQTETEIRRLTNEMKQRREQAEKDFERISRLVKYAKDNRKEPEIDCSGTFANNVKARMIISEHAKLPVGLPKNLKKLNEQPKEEEIEDIFKIDEMIKDTSHEKENYSNSDSDDDSGAIEKRYYNRNRSSSINIARSAPISMPQFNHHAINPDNLDDEKTIKEQQLDIASSIKMLARSVHIDSVFGEMPNRSVLSYNTEF